LRGYEFFGRSMFCGVTDILADEQYLYCSTSGCDVYRTALDAARANA